MYLHPRDTKGNLELEPGSGAGLPDEREQFRRFCAYRGVTDPRTVEARFRAWKGRHGTRPTTGTGAARPDAGGATAG